MLTAADAAKSLQSWSDSVRPINGRPPGCPNPGILQARTLEWEHMHFLLQCMKMRSENEVTQSCLTLCDPMNCSTPGLPVHHQLLEFTKTHVNQVGDAIQPSHPLSSPSPPAPNPFHHQGLLQWLNSAWGGQSIGVSVSASVLPMSTQDYLL